MNSIKFKRNAGFVTSRHFILNIFIYIEERAKMWYNTKVMMAKCAIILLLRKAVKV